MPDQAAQYVVDKIGVVEETSSCVLHDALFYGIVPTIYNINLELWNTLLEKVYTPIVNEMIKTNDR